MLLYSFRMAGFTSSINVEEGNAKFILPRGMEISKSHNNHRFGGVGGTKKKKTPTNPHPIHSD